ncbi:PaaI family thioesterase [candidate division WOR-3 bacterium]|nr:PaaI family thioesterase [candidate division WOR-3 bacterium]
MRLERDNYCFACGKDNPRGMKLDIEVDNDGARFSYYVPREFQGWTDVTHGGIISTMLDEVMVWAAAGQEIMTVTAEITVRFKNPLPTDQLVHVEGQLVEQGKRLVFAQARVFDEKKVYAEANAKLMRARNTPP